MNNAKKLSSMCPSVATIRGSLNSEKPPLAAILSNGSSKAAAPVLCGLFGSPSQNARPRHGPVPQFGSERIGELLHTPTCHWLRRSLRVILAIESNALTWDRSTLETLSRSVVCQPFLPLRFHPSE